jgi:hypothetical protein
MRYLLVLLPLLTACRSGCDGPLEAPAKLGHAPTRVFVTCDASGFSVSNEGDVVRSVRVDPRCVLNSKQVTLGPGGELPDMVIYSTVSTAAPSLKAIIAPGGTSRQDLDMSTLGDCMDTTNAPPGQHEAQPVSLVSDGPADAVFLQMDIYAFGSDEPAQRMDVACPYLQ